MSLPTPWVEKIWEKLCATYGQAFLRQWDGIPIASVKADWGQELSPLQQSPQAIAYGLSNLNPDKAPNALQFRDLCRRAPMTLRALPSATIDQEGLKRVTTELQKLVKMRPEKVDDPRAWAYRLKERDERGSGLTRFQRQCYREALGLEQSGSAA